LILQEFWMHFLYKRREFITLLGGTAVAWPLAGRAQQAGKGPRHGGVGTELTNLKRCQFFGLWERASELGYAEGQNLVIEYRSADGRDDRFPGLARELLALKVDVIVTRGTPAAKAVKNATSTVPVVMTASGDPVGVGLVTSLARPGGNIT